MSNTQDKVMLTVSTFLILLFISGAIIFVIHLAGNGPREISIDTGTIPDHTLHVNVYGAVANPGTYPASVDDTLISLVNSAGLKPEADRAYLAIFVPSHDRSSESQKVNLNRAEAWLILALPEIGTTKAQAIVAYRKQNGPFKSFNDLLKVEGITKSLLDRIKDLITLEE